MGSSRGGVFAGAAGSIWPIVLVADAWTVCSAPYFAACTPHRHCISSAHGCWHLGMAQRRRRRWHDSKGMSLYLGRGRDGKGCRWRHGPLCYHQKLALAITLHDRGKPPPTHHCRARLFLCTGLADAIQSITRLATPRPWHYLPHPNQLTRDWLSRATNQNKHGAFEQTVSGQTRDFIPY